MQEQQNTILEKKKIKKITTLLSKKSHEQLQLWIKKYKKMISIAKEKWLNESDTSNVINDMLCDIFGFEKMLDITTEYKIKWQFCDYWVKVNNKLTFLLEVKAIGVDLNENHIYQASSYASSEWVKWLVLTNLKEWRLYHLSFGAKIDSHLMFSVDILDDQNNKRIEDIFSYLHKESFVKWFIEKLWIERSSLTQDNIKKIFTSPSMVKKVQIDLAKMTKVKVSENEIQEIINKILYNGIK